MNSQHRAQLQPLLLPNLKETGKELGRGAYGVVTEVIVSGTTCAAKKLHDAIIQEYTLKKFSDEVLLHSQQRHPNIVQLIGVYYPSHSQLPMLVMEYLPLSLTQCLERAEELPLEMKYSILLDVAKGLCYLHGKFPPIVHRDLTANNVLLTSSYSAKISDLGVSRLADTFKKHHFTPAPGNPVVMPPEALKANPVYDHKLDVFSYGCLILHVLTGQFPAPAPQFVEEPGWRKSFKKIPEWNRRSSYIKKIPKENELLPLARDCLNDAPTGRPEMIDALQSIQHIISKYPKMKNRLVLEKELNDAIQEKEEAEKKLDEEKKVAERNIQALREENAANKRENEDLKNEKEQMTTDLKTLSLRVTGLQNFISLKEKEFNNSTRVLKETIRSRDEQLVAQQQDNMELMGKREIELNDKHSAKLSETKEEYELKLSKMKEEYEAKLLTTTESYEEQLRKSRKECDTRVAEVMRKFKSKSHETLESTVVSENELLSCFQSVPLASIPSSETQLELIQPYLLQKLKKGDKWCLVDTKWFDKWKTYTRFHFTDEGSAGEAGPHPGPVDNACLFKNSTLEELKNNLMVDKNYTLLPEAAWSLLVSWYGLSVGSRPIVKNVVEHGVHKKLRVEVYLIELKLCVHPNSINIKTYSFSRGDLISDIVTVVKQLFKISDTTECRIWERDFTGKYTILTDFQQTVSLAGLYGGQMLMLEKRNPDETWPRD